MSVALDKLKELVDTLTPEEQAQVYQYAMKKLDAEPPTDEASIAKLEKLKAISRLFLTQDKRTNI